MNMASNISMTNFSSYSMSPLANSVLPSDYPSYVSIKTEADHFSPVQRHICNHRHSQSFPNDPHGLSSCMYSASVSPCLMPSPSSDHCVSMMSSKENSDLRGVSTCRRRLDFNHNAFVDVSKVGPVAVAKRNERERNRVKLINMTFQTLRQHLPLGSTGSKGKSRKLSKVQTLRSAIDYIRQLQELVHSRQQRQQHLGYHGKIGEQSDSMLPCSRDFSNPYQGDNFDLRSPRKRDDSKEFFRCQKNCGSLSVSENEPPHKDVTCPRQLSQGVDSSSTANSNADSPFSDTSSYDAVTTPDDDEFIDFDDWF